MKKATGSLFALVLIVSGCTLIFQSCHRSQGQEQAATPTTQPAPPPIVQPVNDGSGLFFFPVAGEEYRRALRKFYADNPGIHCDYQGSVEKLVERGPWVDAKAYMVTIGHILHCHDLAVEAQSVTQE